MQQGSSRARRGYTVVELMVSTTMIGILVALLLPAVQQARATALRTQCLSQVRNVNLAMLNVVDASGRFPACGNYTREFGRHHSWVIDVLPGLERAEIANRWNKDQPITDSQNLALSRMSIPILACPSDISVVGQGDLSYVVNSGVGHTTYYSGVHDCPVDSKGRKLDLNGDGVSCPPEGSGVDGSPDKELFLAMGLFFNETWKDETTQRHHRFASIVDGLSNTVVLSENVRTGYNPDKKDDPVHSSWASPHPFLTSFFIGNPCRNATCGPGQVDYSAANAGVDAINSGLIRPEGTSAIPNSFHAGGVNMSFADGRVQFISQRIDGRVYAALQSPDGGRLAGTPLDQGTVAADEY